MSKVRDCWGEKETASFYADAYFYQTRDFPQPISLVIAPAISTESTLKLLGEKSVYWSMHSEKAMQMFESLPDEFQQEVIHFIEFLKNKLKKSPSPEKRPASLFGHAKHRVSLAPDFDEPLEDFEGYR